MQYYIALYSCMQYYIELYSCSGHVQYLICLEKHHNFIPNPVTEEHNFIEIKCYYKLHDYCLQLVVKVTEKLPHLTVAKDASTVHGSELDFTSTWVAAGGQGREGGETDRK